MSAMSANVTALEPPAQQEFLPLQSRRVAIVGFTASRRFAPAAADGWEVWGLNNLHLHETDVAQRFTRWFDLHDTKTIEQDAEHAKWLTEGANGIPVLTWQPRDEWPTSLEFPKAALLERFPAYFTNSISWMMALAILELTGGRPVPEDEESPEIGVYGVDMATSGEYGSQRPSCEYFVGVAEGLGIKVTIPPQSDLLKTHSLYGSDEAEGFRTKLEERKFELEQGMGELRQVIANGEQQILDLRLKLASLEGAYENNGYMLGVWSQPITRGNSTH